MDLFNRVHVHLGPTQEGHLEERSLRFREFGLTGRNIEEEIGGMALSFFDAPTLLGIRFDAVSGLPSKQYPFNGPFRWDGGTSVARSALEDDDRLQGIVKSAYKESARAVSLGRVADISQRAPGVYRPTPGGSPVRSESIIVSSTGEEVSV